MGPTWGSIDHETREIGWKETSRIGLSIEPGEMGIWLGPARLKPENIGLLKKIELSMLVLDRF